MYEELNKKLAEWRGWKDVNILEPSLTGYNRLVIQGMYDGKAVSCRLLTDSLDAYVEWLVPKLYWWDLFGFMGEGCRAMVQYKKSSPLIDQHAETPALALCLAIERS